MVKLQPTTESDFMTSVFSYRLSMVKLQRAPGRSDREGCDVLPLEHGKVATFNRKRKSSIGKRYRLSMVKLQLASPACQCKTKHRYRLSMVKLQRAECAIAKRKMSRLPLEHGKVATLTLGVFPEGIGVCYRLSMVKLQLRIRGVSRPLVYRLPLEHGKVATLIVWRE